MKILHLISTARWTGAAEPVFLLCRELMRRGHEVHLGHSSPFRGKRISSQGLRRQGKSGLWIEQSPSGDRPPLEQKAKELNLETLPDLRMNVYFNLRDNLRDWQYLRRLLRTQQYDIIHCHLPHAWYLAVAGSLGWKSKLPLVYSHHSTKPLRTDLLHRWTALRKTRHLICHSPEVLQSFQAIPGSAEPAISLLRGGIDLTPFRQLPPGDAFRKRWNIPADSVVVGMVARMQKRRDHSTLIQAMGKIHGTNVRCLLIGDGEHRPALESLAKKIGVADRVLFPGYLRDHYLQGLAAIDIFVYTAPGSDSSCRAVIEAMAMGKPVVGVRAAAVSLLVEPEHTGFLFQAGEVGDLAQKIQILLDRPELREAMGRQGRMKAERELSIEQLTDAVEEVYKKVCSVPLG